MRCRLAGAIAPGGESDFYRFFARAGTTIRAETVPGTVYDLMLTLYDTDGTTVLQSDDDAAQIQIGNGAMCGAGVLPGGLMSLVGLMGIRARKKRNQH